MSNVNAMLRVERIPFRKDVLLVHNVGCGKHKEFPIVMRAMVDLMPSQFTNTMERRDSSQELLTFANS